MNHILEFARLRLCSNIYWAQLNDLSIGFGKNMMGALLFLPGLLFRNMVDSAF